MSAVECPNIKINQQMCPCTEVDCPRHGICCQCLAYHAESAQWPLSACMRGVKRPEATLSLPKVHEQKCDQYEQNLTRCVCKSDKCERKGTCCDCVRNHWGGEKAVACMRGR
ncbi:MAG: hypothetical protein AB1696_15915 [Planctomycetota bacterium]